MKDSYYSPESFRSNGFAIVKGVLGPVEVNNLRDKILKKLESKDYPRMLLPRDILSDPDLFSHAFNPKIINHLRAAFHGNLTYFPDFQVQHNLFAGWHCDSGSENSNKYLQNPDYEFVKCGIYLQSNTESWGGTIMVTPGCHRYPVRFLPYKLNQKIKNILQRYFIFFRSVTIGLEPGDMLYFDSRLPHTSTLPYSVWDGRGGGTRHFKPNDISNSNAKLILYWDACGQAMVHDFLCNAKIRSDNEKISDEIYYTDYLSRFYPDNYTSEFVDCVDQSMVNIASLSEIEARQRSLLLKNLT